MLKSYQIKLFATWSNCNKYKRIIFFKIEAARRAESTKRTIVILQNRGRPQRNINKGEIVIFQNRSWGLSKIDLQIEFGNIFYTILNYFDPCVSLAPSYLSGKAKIWLK